ncbi:MAG: hypothetical protein AAB462_02490 [Patescibacteria group bacterium]
MSNANEIERIGSELSDLGYSLTSFDQLGLPFDHGLAEELSMAAARGIFSPDAAKLTEHIEKNNMTMVQDEVCLELGRQMVQPVVEAVFVDNPEATQTWGLYAMNRYETGGELGVHQDSVEKTVLVVTISGQRELDVYAKGQTEDDAGDAEQTLLLNPGSVMILDAEADPAHAVRCTEGPSVSAVLDVPALVGR